MAFMIKHSQKLFKAPAYIRDCARLHYVGSRTQASKFNKHSGTQTPGREPSTPLVQKRARSRSFSGLIKRKVLGNQMVSEKKNKYPTPDSVAIGELKRASKENMNL
ncbi:hypothetical protein Celaphus_00008546, partial [Cervus elaphus hippelaphus]